VSRGRRRSLILTIVTSTVVLIGGVAAPAHGRAGAGTAKICVALVLDARAIGSDVSTSCTKVAPGSTGDDVLQAAGHSLRFRSDGLLCTIDGLPKTGCTDVNNNHYWAYYHRAPGSTKWVYSNEGGATYEPVNHSAEGWVYDNGSSLTPANVPQSRICQPAAKASPTPTPSHPATPRPKRPSPTPTAAAKTSAPSATATPVGAATSPAAHYAGGGASSSPTSDQPPAHPSPAGPAGVTGVAASPSATVLASTRLAGGTGSSSSGGHGLLDLLIVLAIVAAAGGFALARSRRTPD
jgi:hypothetical protein